MEKITRTLDAIRDRHPELRFAPSNDGEFWYVRETQTVEFPYPMSGFHAQAWISGLLHEVGHHISGRGERAAWETACRLAVELGEFIYFRDVARAMANYKSIEPEKWR